MYVCVSVYDGFVRLKIYQHSERKPLQSCICKGFLFVTRIPPAIRDEYLHRSYARGDYHKESDIDILLTVDMEQDVIADYYSAVGIVSSDLSLKHDITVSVTVKPLAQFMQYSDVLPYYKNVLRDGIRYGS